MDVGATLRETRERRGLSLEELSRITRIGVPMLRAIERNDSDRLPGGIYTRGFLRAYAREVGLDPEWVVREYSAQFAPPPTGVADGKPDASPPASLPDAETASGRTTRVNPIEMLRVRPVAAWLRPAMPVVGLALMIALFAYLVSDSDAPDSPPITTAQPKSLEGDDAVRASAPRLEVGTSGQRNVNAPDVRQAEAIRLEIQVAGLCWVEATTDGKRTVYRLMQPGERAVVEAREDVMLRVGDPAAFAYRVNGASGRSLGSAGRPATVHITRQNYREFAE